MDGRETDSPLSHMDAHCIFDVLPLPLLLLDQQVCLVFANPAARTLLALNPGQLQGQPIDPIFSNGAAVRAALLAHFGGWSGLPRKTLRLGVRSRGRPRRPFALRAHGLEGGMTGHHILVQLIPVRRRKVRSDARSDRLPGEWRLHLNSELTTAGAV